MPPWMPRCDVKEMMASRRKKTIKEILYWSRRLHASGILQGYEGNLSARLEEDRFLVTASFTDKGGIAKEDILEVNRAGEILSSSGKNKSARKITSEFLLHQRIYQKDPQARYVFHAHPPYGVILTLMNRPMEPPLLVETAAYFGKIPIAPFAMSGTSALPDSVDGFLPRYKAILLQNHGAVTYGETAEETGCKMEILEKSALIYYHAFVSGETLSPLPADALHMLEGMS